MKARRSSDRSRDQRASRFASEPPFIIVTLSAVASGYHAAIAARDSGEPSDRGYPSPICRNASASATGPSSSRILIGSTPDSERS